MKKRYIALPILCLLLFCGYFYYNHRKAAQQKEQQKRQREQNYVLVVDHRPKQLLQSQYTDLLESNTHTICTIGDRKEKSIKLVDDEYKHLSVNDITDYGEVVKAIETAKLGKKRWVYIITADPKLEKSGAMLRDKYNVKKGVHTKAMRFFEEKAAESSKEKPTWITQEFFEEETENKPKVPSKNRVVLKRNYSVEVILQDGIIKDWDIKAITMVDKEGMYYEVYEQPTSQQALIKAGLKQKTEALIQASGYQGNALHLRFDSNMNLTQYAFHSLFKKEESIKSALGLNFDKQQNEKRHHAYFVFYPPKRAEQATNQEKRYIPMDLRAAHKAMKKRQHCSLHFSKITNGYRRGIGPEDAQLDVDDLLVYKLLHKDRKQLEKDIQAIRDMASPIKKVFLYSEQQERVSLGPSWLGMLYNAIGGWGEEEAEENTTTIKDTTAPSTNQSSETQSLFEKYGKLLKIGRGIMAFVVIAIAIYKYRKS